jgi:CBS domain-containing membrane protein
VVLNIGNMKLFPSPKSNNKDAVIGAVGAALGMAITWLVCDALLDGVTPILVLSMGASAVILFTMPTAPAAQPVPVILAHCLAAFFGVASAQIFDNKALAVGVAVGMHAGLMVRLGYMHPPSGGTALTAVIGGDAVTDLGFEFIWRPVLLNAALLVLLAVVFNAPFASRRIKF